MAQLVASGAVCELLVGETTILALWHSYENVGTGGRYAPQGFCSHVHLVTIWKVALMNEKAFFAPLHPYLPDGCTPSFWLGVWVGTGRWLGGARCRGSGRRWQINRRWCGRWQGSRWRGSRRSDGHKFRQLLLVWTGVVFSIMLQQPCLAGETSRKEVAGWVSATKSLDVG